MRLKVIGSDNEPGQQPNKIFAESTEINRKGPGFSEAPTRDEAPRSGVEFRPHPKKKK
jgi:hypothetical protein